MLSCSSEVTLKYSCVNNQNSIIFWPVINPLRSLISIFSLQLHSDPWLPIQTTVWVWWVYWHWSKSLLFPSRKLEICLILLSILQGMYWKKLKKSHNFFDNLQPKYRHFYITVTCYSLFPLIDLNKLIFNSTHPHPHIFSQKLKNIYIVFFYYWKISFYKQKTY